MPRTHCTGIFTSTIGFPTNIFIFQITVQLLSQIKPFYKVIDDDFISKSVRASLKIFMKSHFVNSSYTSLTNLSSKSLQHKRIV